MTVWIHGLSQWQKIEFNTLVLTRECGTSGAKRMRSYIDVFFFRVNLKVICMQELQCPSIKKYFMQLVSREKKTVSL
jgi:hypothetical protein